MGHTADETTMITVDFLLKRNEFDVSIHETFHQGITGIYGPSGSGKTSLLNVIAGLEIPEIGSVMVRGNVLFNAAANISIPAHRRHIGYVFQEGRLFPHMSVLKNLLYGMNKKRKPLLGCDDVVDMLKLRHLLKTKPDTLSGGERQRVALGRALLSSPEILLLDEPFSAVDTRLRGQIIPYILEVQRRINVPILVVSHELTDLLKLTDRICVIKEGECIGHDDYHMLLASEQVASIFGSGSVLNTVTMNVADIDEVGGITELTTSESDSSVRVVCEKSMRHYIPGQTLKVFISSHDIALSSARLAGVTIQNQIEGIVTDRFERNATTFCVVDTGFKLIVEITAESGRRLDIKIGSRVWCLFKSVAIDVAG
jgi:molybdate transport system ATP-binding protein